jgi:hypothetical protein
MVPDPNVLRHANTGALGGGRAASSLGARRRRRRRQHQRRLALERKVPLVRKVQEVRRGCRCRRLRCLFLLRHGVGVAFRVLVLVVSSRLSSNPTSDFNHECLVRHHAENHVTYCFVTVSTYLQDLQVHSTNAPGSESPKADLTLKASQSMGNLGPMSYINCATAQQKRLRWCNRCTRTCTPPPDRSRSPPAKRRRGAAKSKGCSERSR